MGGVLFLRLDFFPRPANILRSGARRIDGLPPVFPGGRAGKRKGERDGGGVEDEIEIAVILLRAGLSLFAADKARELTAGLVPIGLPARAGIPCDIGNAVPIMV